MTVFDEAELTETSFGQYGFINDCPREKIRFEIYFSLFSWCWCHVAAVKHLSMLLYSVVYDFFFALCDY